MQKYVYYVNICTAAALRALKDFWTGGRLKVYIYIYSYISVTDSDLEGSTSQTVTDAHGVGAHWRRGPQTVTDAHGVRATLAQGDTRHSYTN